MKAQMVIVCTVFLVVTLSMVVTVAPGTGVVALQLNATELQGTLDVKSGKSTPAPSAISTQEATPTPIPTTAPPATPILSDQSYLPVDRVPITADNAAEIVSFRRVIRDWYNAATWSADGRYFIEAGLESSFLIYDTLGDLRPVVRGRPAGFSTAITISNDGTLIALSPYMVSAIIVDRSTGWRRHELDNGTEDTQCLAFSPDSSVLAVGSEDGNIRIYDTETGERAYFIRAEQSWVDSLAFSPDGTILASGGGGTKGVMLWEAGSWQEIVELPNDHWGLISALAFSPDGTILASGDGMGGIILWDVAQRRSLASLDGHDRGINDLAFSPDGSLLASASEDGTVRIWEVPTGRHLAQLSDHEDAVDSVQFSADGTLLGTAGDDERLFFWGVFPEGVAFPTETPRGVIPTNQPPPVPQFLASWTPTATFQYSPTPSRIPLGRRTATPSATPTAVANVDAGGGVGQ
jgi:WD40 repeat protein